ncbi:MAG: sigma-70 family RNA polymerase sigma factor [Limosilactobacillus sp.]|uniref:sigma-70 family RNA polymerase sigma factor n=1 Tax=Limosilactobacillus sp. TaxID=2773925 RepID=UPI002701A739|nr:sigma-70 family RNA polymerase sigma factor [Limosilactobacillus sp.]
MSNFNSEKNKINKKVSEEEVIVEEQVDEQVIATEEFADLFHQYMPLVRKLWQFYYVADLELDDWIQEASMVFLKVLKSYKGETREQLGGFFKQSLVNRILDLYRSRQANKRIPEGKLSALTDDYNELVRDTKWGEPEDISFCQQCLRRLMEELSDFERDVLVSLHQGYTTDELAEKMNCSKRKIQSSLSRSRMKLLKIMKQ